MKVTLVTPPPSGSGGQRVIAEHARRLIARGHSVTIAYRERARPGLRKSVRSLLRGEGWPRPAAQQWSFLDSLNGAEIRVAAAGRPIGNADVPDADVVVATWWETAEWVRDLSPAKGAKAYFIQGYEVWGGPPERVEATWRLPMQKIIISKWLMDLAINKYGDPTAAHVPNSVDLEQFHAAERGRQSAPTVGLLYSTHECKGLDVSVRALAIIAKHVPDLRVVSFGYTPPTADLPLPPGTSFTTRPAQDKIKDLYAQCDVWMCGSRSEGFHLPPLEAMACRCPVVSTKVGGPMDIVKDGVNGFLVDIDDAETLAERIIRVLRSAPAEWATMSDAAYATAHASSWERSSELFEEALRAAIARRRPTDIQQPMGSTRPARVAS